MNTDTPSSFVAPEIVISHFHIKDGDTVADFGAGSGYFLPELARRTGSHGRVYACEIQKVLVEKVGEQARQLGLSNIHPLWCDLEEPGGIKIKDDMVDVGLLANTLFQIQDKEVAVLEMGRTIRTGGRLIIIDWSDSFSGMGPTADHVITTEETTALLEAHHFVLEQTFPAGSHHYGLVFRKI
jgi:ubiquinone/menaquinone biosynthesis C-methylase UbiE